jgi:ketosteroid isomerase-like protein
MSQETVLIERYFDAFNRHDLEGVMACFDREAVIVAAHGRRLEGVAAIRDYYASTFALFRDARCTIRTLVGEHGTGAVESLFTGTRAGAEHPTRLMGVEVLEFCQDKITALRDYHTVSDATA